MFEGRDRTTNLIRLLNNYSTLRDYRQDAVRMRTKRKQLLENKSYMCTYSKQFENKSEYQYTNTKVSQLVL